MRCLVRTQVAVRPGTTETRDVEYRADTLTLGRGAETVLHLEGSRVQELHAEISLAKGQVRIRAADGAALFVNDKPVKSADLKHDDRIRIGAHTLTVVPAPQGFDLALALESAEDEDDEGLSFVPGAMSLESAGLTKRRWSWLLMVAVLVVGLGLPLAWSLWPDAAGEGRPHWLPMTDAIWSSGPLSSVHHVPGVGDNCQGCHTKPFVQVEDQACNTCHTMADHASTQVENSPFSQFTCAGCHREHNEPAQLVRRDEAQCVDCHQALAKIWPEPSELRDVTDFAQHPPFKVSLVTPEDEQGKSWTTQRLALSTESLTEISNLKFSHAQHLSADGIDSPSGKQVLECAACHQPQQNGRLMQPISMEAHCSSCHTLAFEPTDPERQVPHGEPAQVLRSLEEYYARLYAIQGGPVESVLELRRDARRPGQPTKEFYAAMERWADARALKATQDLLEGSACQSCHEVTVNAKAKGAERWDVLAVRLTEQWMPKSVFDHQAHRQTECSSCHMATESKQATDVLMPDLDNCQQCHAGERGAALKIATGCVSCHSYHTDHLQGKKQAIMPHKLPTPKQSPANLPAEQAVIKAALNQAISNPVQP